MGVKHLAQILSLSMALCGLEHVSLFLGVLRSSLLGCYVAIEYAEFKFLVSAENNTSITRDVEKSVPRISTIEGLAATGM